MKILIAEDNLALQEMNEQLMNRWGYDFDIVSNGKEAVEHAQKNEGKYDLCIMDIDMPIINGLQATEIIRRKLKYFPIMAFSGNPMHREECLKIGMDDFLEKPYRLDKLYAKINELTVKSEKVDFKGNNFLIKKEMPMDQQHAKELRELAKEGLCKMNIRGIGPHDVEVVTHKNIPYKISQDFIEKGDEVTIFLDRSKEKPAECHLYKSSCPMPKIYLQEEEFEEKRKKEDEVLKDCTAIVTKKEQA